MKNSQKTEATDQSNCYQIDPFMKHDIKLEMDDNIYIQKYAWIEVHTYLSKRIKAEMHQECLHLNCYCPVT